MKSYEVLKAINFVKKYGLDLQVILSYDHEIFNTEVVSEKIGYGCSLPHNIVCSARSARTYETLMKERGADVKSVQCPFCCHPDETDYSCIRLIIKREKGWDKFNRYWKNADEFYRAEMIDIMTNVFEVLRNEKS